MKSTHLERVKKLLDQVQPELATAHQLEFKNIFGAVGGYVDGRIFITCGKFGTALKLPPNTLNSLFQEPDVEHLRYFPNGHVKKEYAVLPTRILEDPDEISKLVDVSIRYVQLTAESARNLAN